jgi:hypothetical protein
MAAVLPANSSRLQESDVSCGLTSPAAGAAGAWLNCDANNAKTTPAATVAAATPVQVLHSHFIADMASSSPKDAPLSTQRQTHLSHWEYDERKAKNVF